jgi:hypothetical protein
MYTLCWSVKGGSGTTVVAAALGLICARTGPTVLVDLGGDVAPALGVAPSGGPGVGEWLASPGAGAERLWQVAHECGDDLRLVHPGAMPMGAEFTDLAAERLASACADAPFLVVVDAGPIVPTTAMHHLALSSLLVVRPCYLALRRAVTHLGSTSHVVMVDEPGRCLSRVDVERALDARVVATVPWDPAVARAVDAGLLHARLPSTVARPLARLISIPDPSTIVS